MNQHYNEERRGKFCAGSFADDCRLLSDCVGIFHSISRLYPYSLGFFMLVSRRGGGGGNYPGFYGFRDLFTILAKCVMT